MQATVALVHAAWAVGAWFAFQYGTAAQTRWGGDTPSLVKDVLIGIALLQGKEWARYAVVRVRHAAAAAADAAGRTPHGRWLGRHADWVSVQATLLTGEVVRLSERRAAYARHYGGVTLQ